jgi:hypothetical protein
MRLMMITTAALLLATSAIAEPVKTRANNKNHPARVIAPPPDRYFDAAHGPDDPHSLWFAGDYIGRDQISASEAQCFGTADHSSTQTITAAKGDSEDEPHHPRLQEE